MRAMTLLHKLLTEDGREFHKTRLRAVLVGVGGLLDDYLHQEMLSIYRALVRRITLSAGAFRPGETKGYQHEEYTHTTVGALVVSRDADVAFGSQSAEERFDLHFKVMVEERFYIVINREFDNAVRQFVTEFCARLEFADVDRMGQDEFVPTVAVMKRVHGVGSWRQV